MSRRKNKLKVCVYGYVFVSLLKWRRKRRWAVHPLNRSRAMKGEFAVLAKELEQYPERYYGYFRMPKDRFDFILRHIRSRITGHTTKFKTPISPKEKLVLTLQFLATGASFSNLAWRFRMGATTVRKHVLATVNAIVDVLRDIMMPKQTKESWKKISNEFYKKWNFPNCLGAADGKHVILFCPAKSGSENYNYKKTFSMNLMAVVDASYKFIAIDVGAAGSNHDATVFYNSNFNKDWFHQARSLHLPPKSPLPNTQELVPYQIIADDAFGQSTIIMTPFPGSTLWKTERIFNYRLSRARRVVENAFGILCHTWRILLKRIETSASFAKKIVVACCTLHNFLKMSMGEIREILSHEPLSNNDEPIEPMSISTDRTSTAALGMRNKFAHWCVKEGDVRFQYQMI